MNKTALVTGASGGIGSAVCQSLAADGFNIIAHYASDENGAKALCRRLESTYNVRTLCLRADFSDYRQVLSLAEKADAFGQIQVLVNNAGIACQSLFQSVTTEKADEIFSVNIGSAMLLTQKILPQMISRQSGRIINISSMWGVTGGSCEVHYSASKAAVIGFTKALAKEAGPSGITVNCIAPGLIDTKMNGALDNDAKKAIIDETPLCRIGTPQDVAALVSFLAGDAASFITGQVICVDGGLTI